MNEEQIKELEDAVRALTAMYAELDGIKQDYDTLRRKFVALYGTECFTRAVALFVDFPEDIAGVERKMDEKLEGIKLRLKSGSRSWLRKGCDEHGL